MSFDFPSELLSVQVELVQAKADLAEVYAALPWSVEELQGWSRAKETGGGYYESHRPDSPGWSVAEQQQVAELRARVLELSERVVTHEFWSTCDDAPVARSALKHATAEAPDPA
ncbi:hypothetical protein ACFXPZ_13900 [Streptomyces sp. NPDC059101]|uniref:hypothetical protein n=1 Tax=Streptomyces sp. NPDC059101 TaxID=3346728 RepID=UPI00369FE62C